MRSGHLDNGHLGFMKYIITEIFINDNGRVVFDSVNGIEVFDHYVSALRWLVKERAVSLHVGWHVTYEQRGSVSEYGRIEIGLLRVFHENSFSKFYLSRVNENGFH